MKPADTPNVAFNSTHLILLIMAVMAYVLVTTVMTLLTCRIKNELQKHQLVRESRLIRQQYLQELIARREAGTGDVHIH